MAPNETTPQERRDYILEQRAAEEAHKGPGRRIPGEMSFIDRKGNIIKPTKADYEARKRKLKEPGDYESRPRYDSLIIAILCLLLGLFFLSPNLTGNVIANLTTKTSNIVGVGLFILGIVGSYFYFKKK